MVGTKVPAGSWISRAKIPPAVVVGLRLGQRIPVPGFQEFTSTKSMSELSLRFDDPGHGFHEQCVTRVPLGWKHLKTHVMSRCLIGNITWELQGTDADTLVIRESIECRGCVPSMKLLCRQVIGLKPLTLSAKNNAAVAEGPLEIALEWNVKLSGANESPIYGTEFYDQRLAGRFTERRAPWS